MVGLGDLCSYNSPTPVTTDRMRQLLTAFETGDMSEPKKSKRTRLTPTDQQAVMHRHSNGETSTALAEDIKVAKSTILRILRENSVVVRRQPLTDKQVTLTKRLYESGLSLSEVAQQKFVNQETIRVAIIKAGVKLRPASGR
jgi:transposase-like protein